MREKDRSGFFFLRACEPTSVNTRDFPTQWKKKLDVFLTSLLDLADMQRVEELISEKLA